ncbi:MAG: HEPN domain-containing protein [Patescibacteria group bacterium]
MVLKTIKNINNKHWISLANGYLKLSKQGFLYFKKQEDLGKIKFSENSKEKYLLEDGNMIIASIWNIKHAIELGIKGVGIELGGIYPWGHNLKELLKDLDDKLRDFCTQEHINFLKTITVKYYTCNFSDKNIINKNGEESKEIEFVDEKNDLFRYPEVDGFYLDYSFVHGLEKKDIDIFLKDIDNLKLIFSIIESQPAIFKAEKEWGIPKKETERKILEILKTKNSDIKK